MPSDQKTMYEPGNPKTSSIFIGAIVRCKQYKKIPQNFKVPLKLALVDEIMVLKARETKRYEFEAVSEAQASEIVHKIVWAHKKGEVNCSGR
jgi:target of rapamycin complex 2 subunit MAPKAP1/AVO1